MTIHGIDSGISRMVEGASRAPGQADGDGESFAAAVTKMLRDVNADQVDAAREVQSLVVDGKGSIHDAMVAMSKAEGSFRLAMEMRNRLIDGINRLLQTQV